MPLSCHLTGNFSPRVRTSDRLKYPAQLLHSTINDFITKKVSGDPGINQTSDEKKASVRIILPFKDQTSANSARRQLGDLNRKIGTDISPVYTSRKIENARERRSRRLSRKNCTSIFSLFSICQRKVTLKFNFEGANAFHIGPLWH